MKLNGNKEIHLRIPEIVFKLEKYFHFEEKKKNTGTFDRKK